MANIREKANPTVQDVYESLTQTQKELLHYNVGCALADRVSTYFYTDFTPVQRKVAVYIVNQARLMQAEEAGALGNG